MDNVDQANDRAEIFRREALETHFSRRGIHLKSEVVAYPGGGAAVNIGGGPSPGPRGCVDCGKAISLARLEAKPDAVRYIDCQIKKERI